MESDCKFQINIMRRHGSRIRMIQYFINRGGRGLPASRRRELEKAKRILQERRKRQRA